MAEQEIRYTKAGRPWPQPLAGIFWRDVRLASLVLLLLLWGLTLYFFSIAPGEIVTKLDATGAVIAQGSRWNFFLLPVVCVLVYIGMEKMLQRPDMVNFGRMIITQANYVQQYELARKFIACLRGLFLILANILTYTMAQTAALVPAVIPDFTVTALWIVIVAVVIVWRIGAERRNRRMDKDV